ncbi:MAG: hypothetical protein JWL70_220 [Acidimicrobiia bacterium]|nr:hypothetical protein [Acidimicrobiia bacterium]
MATTADAALLLGAISELADLLSVDGASLRVVSIDEAAPRVELEVGFDGIACEECVLPPDRLSDTAGAIIAKHAGRPVDVVLHDPRRAGVATSSGSQDQRWLEILDPSGVAPDFGVPDPGPAAGSIKGKTVAIRCDVLWHSFDWTVEEWAKSLEAAGAKVVMFRRTQGQVGADLERAQAEYEAVLAQADVVFSGLGNCGSCTSWSVRDALTAAAKGLPVAAVATAHFEPLARVLAAEGGRPGLRLMVLPYPYDTLSEDAVRAHAQALFPQLLEALGATV